MKYIVDIKGEIEGDYEIIGKYEERPQGEWECARIGNTNFITCSHCKEQFETENTLELWQDEYKFCHRCGAKMGGEEE